MLWDFVLWDFVLWDFVRRDFVLWDVVLWDSVPDSVKPSPEPMTYYSMCDRTPDLLLDSPTLDRCESTYTCLDMTCDRPAVLL